MVSFLSQLSSGDASDSICPKGWGIVEYSGDGGYYKLIRSIYSVKTGEIVRKYKEYNTEIRPDDVIIQLPFLFVHSGRYDNSSGELNARITYGRFWEKEIYSTKYAEYFEFYYGNIASKHFYSKEVGMSVRCVAK